MENIKYTNEEKFTKFVPNRNEYLTNLFKTTIAECASRLYFGSMLFDVTNEMVESIKPIAFDCFMETMNESNTIKDVKEQLKKTSPYIQSAMCLADRIVESHDPIVKFAPDSILIKESKDSYCSYRGNAIYNIKAKTLDEAISEFDTSDEIKNGTPDGEKTVKEFPKKDLLDPIDMGVISAWEKDIGKDIYANALRDRITKVFTAESEAMDRQKERIQNITDLLASQAQKNTSAPTDDTGVNMDPNNTVDDANSTQTNPVVESAMTFIKTEPRSLFNAIFMNKSRAVITESGTGDLITDHAEDIMKETLATYGIYECINSLGLHTYSNDEKRSIITEFYLESCK